MGVDCREPQHSGVQHVPWALHAEHSLTPVAHIQAGAENDYNERMACTTAGRESFVQEQQAPSFSLEADTFHTIAERSSVCQRSRLSS